MLVDTNLIIYSSQSRFAYLRPLFLEGEATVSRITRVMGSYSSGVVSKNYICFL